MAHLKYSGNLNPTEIQQHIMYNSTTEVLPLVTHYIELISKPLVRDMALAECSGTYVLDINVYTGTPLIELRFPIFIRTSNNRNLGFSAQVILQYDSILGTTTAQIIGVRGGVNELFAIKRALTVGPATTEVACMMNVHPVIVCTSRNGFNHVLQAISTLVCCHPNNLIWSNGGL